VPSTVAKPMINVLKHRNIGNIVAVVIGWIWRISEGLHRLSSVGSVWTIYTQHRTESYKRILIVTTISPVSIHFISSILTVIFNILHITFFFEWIHLKSPKISFISLSFLPSLYPDLVQKKTL